MPVPDTVVVGFPLRGAGWMAANGPGDLVPSHGTDLLGQRYAYDFLQVDGRRKLRYHPAGTLRTLFLGVPTVECYAWGEPVVSPRDGEVVAAMDGASGRRWVHPIGELALALWNGMVFKPARLPKLLGNHVILRIGEVYAAFAHLATDSVAVALGEQVQAGQLLGRVGHTGNSTAPHLHFQLMDSSDPLTARGVPCSFDQYDVLRDRRWERVTGGVPRRGERIRAVGD